MPLNAQAIIALISGAVGIIFGAGFRDAKFRQVQKDLNGLGAKVRLLQGLLIRWANGDEDKIDQIARLVEGKWSN